MDKVEKVVTTSDSDTLDTVSAQTFGIYDIFIIVALLSLAIYYLWYKKESKPTPRNTYMVEPNTSSVDGSSFITKMKQTGRRIIVFYGTQTGTAEEFAVRIAKEANRYGLKAMVADPEEYEMDDLSNVSEIPDSLAVFCMATYGEGDPTDNAQDFCAWLKSTGADLAGLNYAVFGLGNRTYEHFNSMAKLVDEKLAELGATRVYQLGLGDDDKNLEDDFITWKEKFWESVCNFFDIQTLGEDISMRQYQLILHNDISPENLFTGEPTRLHSYKNQKGSYDNKNPFLAPITLRRELYTGPRSCMHIELDITEAKMRYETGDHAAIYPSNDPVLVEKLAKLLDVNLDTVFSLKNLDEDSSKKYPFPCPTTYRTALMHYVDITSIPRTHVLKEISEYASNEEHKKMLKLMSSSAEEGRSTYLSWVVKNCRSIIHILEDLPTLKPPLDQLLELLPRLHPRYYSISSSPKLHPKSVHVTAVVIEYTTPTNRDVTGVTTGWLKDLPAENGNCIRIPMFIRHSQFNLPSKTHAPIIMIGPGTGLAPFRGFIQERHCLRKDGQNVGDTILYYGCRKEKEDFLYKEELEKFHEEGTLTKLYLAFSRDQPQKVYVTHLLKQNKEEIWDVIGKKEGHIYVCGDARNMAKDVHNIILEVIQELGQKTQGQAEEFLKKMESHRRYSADVWS